MGKTGARLSCLCWRQISGVIEPVKKGAPKTPQDCSREQCKNEAAAHEVHIMQDNQCTTKAPQQTNEATRTNLAAGGREEATTDTNKTAVQLFGPPTESAPEFLTTIEHPAGDKEQSFLTKEQVLATRPYKELKSEDESSQDDRQCTASQETTAAEECKGVDSDERIVSEESEACREARDTIQAAVQASSESAGEATHLEIVRAAKTATKESEPLKSTEQRKVLENMSKGTQELDKGLQGGTIDVKNKCCKDGPPSTSSREKAGSTECKCSGEEVCIICKEAKLHRRTEGLPLIVVNEPTASATEVMHHEEGAGGRDTVSVLGADTSKGEENASKAAAKKNRRKGKRASNFAPHVASLNHRESEKPASLAGNTNCEVKPTTKKARPVASKKASQVGAERDGPALTAKGECGQTPKQSTGHPRNVAPTDKARDSATVDAQPVVALDGLEDSGAVQDSEGSCEQTEGELKGALPIRNTNDKSKSRQNQKRKKARKARGKRRHGKTGKR